MKKKQGGGKVLSFSNLVDISKHREGFSPNLYISENAEKIDTILGLESIFLLLKENKFDQFTKLFSFHYKSLKDSQDKTILIKALESTLNNFFSEVSQTTSFESLHTILSIYEKTSRFISKSEYIDGENFLLAVGENTDKWLIGIFDDIFTSYSDQAPREKYREAIDVYLDIRHNNRTIDGYKLNFEQIGDRLVQYFNEVFGAYVALENYDSLTLFVLSNERFKSTLDIDYVKYKLFPKLLDKLKSCKSQEQAKQLIFCIGNLTAYFAPIERIFMNIFYKNSTEIYKNLPKRGNVLEFPQRQSSK